MNTSSLIHVLVRFTLGMVLAVPTLQGVEPGQNFMNAAGMEMVWTGHFWVAKTETSQKVMESVGQKNTSTMWKGQADKPANNVTFVQALQTALELTKKEQAAGNLPEGWHYSLPTVAMWRNLRQQPTLKLDAMQGGVSEWCLDKFSPKLNEGLGLSNGLFTQPRPGFYSVAGTSHRAHSSDYDRGIYPMPLSTKTGSANSIMDRQGNGEIGFRLVLVKKP